MFPLRFCPGSRIPPQRQENRESSFFLPRSFSARSFLLGIFLLGVFFLPRSFSRSFVLAPFFQIKNKSLNLCPVIFAPQESQVWSFQDSPQQQRALKHHQGRKHFSTKLRVFSKSISGAKTFFEEKNHRRAQNDNLRKSDDIQCRLYTLKGNVPPPLCPGSRIPPQRQENRELKMRSFFAQEFFARSFSDRSFFLGVIFLAPCNFKKGAPFFK